MTEIKTDLLSDFRKQTTETTIIYLKVVLNNEQCSTSLSLILLLFFIHLVYGRITISNGNTLSKTFYVHQLYIYIIDTI